MKLREEYSYTESSARLISLRPVSLRLGERVLELAARHGLANGEEEWSQRVVGDGQGEGVTVAIIDSGVSNNNDFGTRLTRVRLPLQLGSLDDTPAIRAPERSIPTTSPWI